MAPGRLLQRFRLAGVLLLAALSVVGLPATASAAEETPLSARLKAAFLFNFARFTEWPAALPGDSAPLFHFCIIGNDRLFEAANSTIKDKRINGLPVEVKSPPRPADAAHCEIVYLARAQPEWLAAFVGRPVLIVGEGREFPSGSGMVGFHVVDGRLRFAINPEHARDAGLRMSSRLLSLADIVREGGA